MDIDFEPGWQERITRQAGVRALRRDSATDVASLAGALAGHASGTYADSLEVEEAGDAIRVVSSDPSAHIIEFGSIDTPAQAPMRRAADAAGLDVVEEPRR